MEILLILFSASTLNLALATATPIALGSYAGLFSERSGVVNIAIEGMMLVGAMSASMVSAYTGSLFLGVIAGLVSGALMAALHAVLSIRFKMDQIISGTVINFLAAGLTGHIYQIYLVPPNWPGSAGTFTDLPIPVLSEIPFIGQVLFQHQPVVYIMLILTVVIHLVLFYTPWGLRTRAVGEHPKAADTLGINVFKMRYINVIMGGMVAGLGGAYFTIGSVGRFDEVLTAGKGFIGLAAMIFGKWTPLGSFGASMIFGFADALQVKLQGLGIAQVPIPSEFMLMAPYLVTMVVLAGVIGRAVSPAADGQPYNKD